MKRAQRLSDSQYADIGKTIHLLSAVEYELFRTLVAFGASEAELENAAKGTMRGRKTQLIPKIMADNNIETDYREKILERLETAAILRDQFTHGIWVRQEDNLICKFIKRHKDDDGFQNIALSSIEIPPDKFEIIHRNLEYLLVDLEVLQETRV